MTVSFQKVAVIGAGAMGRGIAQIAAQAGSQVWLYDAQAEAIAKDREAPALHDQRRDQPTSRNVRRGV